MLGDKNNLAKKQGRRRGGRGKQSPHLPIIGGSMGSKNALPKVEKNPFQTLIWYNGDQISYINKQFRIGRKRDICMVLRNIASAKGWNKNSLKKGLG